MDRQLCQDYLATKDLKVLPSNCLACPFMSETELEYLRRFESESLEDLVGLEAAKLERFSHLNAVQVLDGDGNPVTYKNGTPKTTNKNYGVWGIKPLPVKIEEVKEKFADVSDDYIIDYRYSHGHCVTASY